MSPQRWFVPVGLVLAASLNPATADDKEVEERIAEARETYEAKVSRAKAVFEKVQERELERLIRIYDVSIRSYENKGDTEAVERLTAERAALASGEEVTTASGDAPEWKPVPDSGNVASAFSLGPLPEGVDDRLVLAFLYENRFFDKNDRALDAKFSGIALNQMVANEKNFQFSGPPRTGTALFYIFYLKADSGRAAATLHPKVHTQYDHHFSMRMYFDFRPVAAGVKVPLTAKGHHVVVKVVNKRKAEPFSFTIVGDGISHFN